jgi:hypothetical protein
LIQTYTDKKTVLPSRTLSNHLAEMPILAFPLNSDLLKGFGLYPMSECGVYGDAGFANGQKMHQCP